MDIYYLKVINELRLRLPISERDVITAEAKKAASGEDDYETKRALKLAQATISSLQVCFRSWLFFLVNFFKNS